MLGTPKSLASGVAQWSNWPISSSVSGRMPWRTTARPRHLALRRGDLDRVAVGDAEPCRGLRVDDHAAVAGDVVGDLLDHLHADVVAPGVLHAARGEQPERIVRAAAPPWVMTASHSAGKSFHVGRAWYSVSCSSHQCMSCSCRRLPSSAPTRFSRSWYGSSKRRPCSLSVGNRYQSGARKRLGREAVLLPPGEPVRLGAVAQLGARRAAHRVPDFVAVMAAVERERKVGVLALERHAARRPC